MEERVKILSSFLGLFLFLSIYRHLDINTGGYGMITVTLPQYRNWVNFTLARQLCPECMHDEVVTAIIKEYKTNIKITDINVKIGSTYKTVLKVINRYNAYMEDLVDEILQCEGTTCCTEGSRKVKSIRLRGKSQITYSFLK